MKGTPWRPLKEPYLVNKPDSTSYYMDETHNRTKIMIAIIVIIVILMYYR